MLLAFEPQMKLVWIHRIIKLWNIWIDIIITTFLLHVTLCFWIKYSQLFYNTCWYLSTYSIPFSIYHCIILIFTFWYRLQQWSLSSGLYLDSFSYTLSRIFDRFLKIILFFKYIAEQIKILSKRSPKIKLNAFSTIDSFNY